MRNKGGYISGSFSARTQVKPMALDDVDILVVPSATNIGKNLTLDKKRQIFKRFAANLQSKQDKKKLNKDVLLATSTLESGVDISNVQLISSESQLVQRIRRVGKYHRSIIPDKKLAAWITRLLPEDWQSDLEELHHELLAQKGSKLAVNLLTLKSLLEMVWAELWIKSEDLILPIQQETKQ